MTRFGQTESKKRRLSRPGGAGLGFSHTLQEERIMIIAMLKATVGSAALSASMTTHAVWYDPELLRCMSCHGNRQTWRCTFKLLSILAVVGLKYSCMANLR